MNEMIGSPKVKTRSLPNVVVSGQKDRVYNAAHVLQTETAIADYTTNIQGETIVYTTKRANQRAKSNFCHHTRETFTYSGGKDPTTIGAVSPAGWTVDYNSHHAHICNARASIVSAAETSLVQTKGAVLGANGLGIINGFFANVQPDLTSVSIPNFLFDIKEVTKLYKLWKYRSYEAPRYIRNVKRATKKDVVSAIPAKYIGYKFGWKPTVADLSELIDGVLNLRAKIKAFNDSIGGLIERHTSVKLDLPTSATGSIAWPSGNHSASYTATCTRVCAASITYAPQQIAAINSLDLTCRALLDSMGFELNPRIIWDAIPFSFVVDWFFGVGSFLDRFRVDTLELPIVLVDSYVSYKENLNIEWSWLRANDGQYTSRPKSAGARYSRKFFHRMPTYPDFASLAGLGWKMPTLNQAALGVSLAAVLGGANRRGL